jgi:hypothetical protein
MAVAQSAERLWKMAANVILILGACILLRV